jgi:hypothetical protein
MAGPQSRFRKGVGTANGRGVVKGVKLVRKGRKQKKRINKLATDTHYKGERHYTRLMSNTTVNVICMIVPLLLSGFANFYAHKSWILYLPLAGILLLIGYVGHLAIRSADETRSEQKLPPAATPTPTQVQRPYVTLHHAVPKLDNIGVPEGTTLVELVLENSGKEPAYNVLLQATAFIAFQKLSATPKAQLPTLPESGGSFLGVDRQMTVVLGAPDAADSDLKGKIERGEVFLYVFGVTTYVNRIDNKTHKSEFCGLYVPQRKGFDQTLFGNDMD